MARGPRRIPPRRSATPRSHARAAIERERDEARRRVAELEQRLREGLQPPPPPPPGPGP